MGRVDDERDRMLAQMAREPFGAAEAADPHVAREIVGRLAEAGEAVHVVRRERARDAQRVARAAQQQHPVRAHRATPTMRPSRSIASVSTSTSSGTMSRATRRACAQTTSPSGT